MADVTAAVRGLWWLVLLRGILAILFGLFALFAPGTALLALVFVFGAYAILDGVTALALGIRNRKEDPHWVWHLVQGVVSVLAGIIAFVWPGVTVLAILFVIAFWSIVGGIAEIVESFMMRKRGGDGWGWVLAAGIVSVLFGIVLLVSPGAALITLLWLVGAWAIVFGVIIIVWAVRLRRTVSAAAQG
ncbi:MAG: HdeD family acid-resistance protein [Pseudonocardia sp.]|nr:HdeD family acid-resistance protein [Pseudonocardia sp.]